MATMRAELFHNGGNQAVRLPRECRFPEGETDVAVRRDGRRVILEPVDEWPEDFLMCLGSLSDEIGYALRGHGNVGEDLARRRPSDLCVRARARISSENPRSGDRRRSRRIHAAINGFLSAVQAMPLVEVTAARFGAEAAALTGAGVPISQADTLLAIHASASDATLVTNNGKHFSKVHGPRVENWM